MPRSVLLIDRDEDTRVILRTVLEHYRYRVAVAADQDEGLLLAQQDRPDLIILECPLAFEDGSLLMDRLRNEPDLQTTSIVSISARILPDDRLAAFEAASDALLNKPLFPMQVVQVVDRLIGPASES